MASKQKEVKETAARRGGPDSSSSLAANIKFVYLVAYNALSKLGWLYVLYLSITHLAALSSLPASEKAQTASAAASATLQKLLSKVPLTLRNATPLTQVQAAIWDTVPAGALPYIARAKTLYPVAGLPVAIVQTTAVLEIVHALTGLVRSPVATTAIQVASRLFLVWGIVERFPETQSNGIYASMVVAWALADIIRYTLYVTNLFGYKPYALQWLRYTAFYVLYPVGASSEAFLIFSTLPSLTTSSINFFSRKWDVEDYARGALFVLWWPGLFVMMSYMASQRRKVLGGGKKKKTA